MTHSPVGGLPLGTFITSSESQFAIGKGLALLKNKMPSVSAFYRRGTELGPAVMMTDGAERDAIAEVWPECRLLLCTFHVLKAAWK